MKTDNSYTEEKILLRLKAIEKIDNPIILECYAGNGILWDEVKKRTNKKVQILRIEKEKNKGFKTYLQGDNLKYLSSIELGKFNVIDLDAYGIPAAQLDIIFNRNFKGVIIVTAIQTMQGALPHSILLKNGYTKQMIKKIPTLFYRNGIDKLKNYLYISGINEIEGYFIDNKNYFYFNV